MTFTQSQIDDIHNRLGNADTFLDYIRALHAIGVETYDSFLTDGHSEFIGKQGDKVVSPAYHEKLPIAETSNKEAFLKHLKLHEQGKTDYVEMSRGLAESGIEKWTVDTVKTTITYYDKAGNALLIETIK